MIQGVIFDFDNTIYDYDICNNLSLYKVFNYIKENFNKENVSNNYDKINKDIKEGNNYNNKFNKSIYFKKLLENLNISLENLDKILEMYNEEFNKNMLKYVNPGLEDLLKLLKRDNIKIAILSNNIFGQQYDKLVKLDFIKYIDYIQTSDEIGYEKPDELIFLALINKMKIPAENIIMIGDNYEHDIEPALKLGLISFHFNNKKTSLSELKLKDKYFEFQDYLQLINFYSEYISSEDELIFLSKLYGQSIINIQGQGGNISVKTFNNNLLLIKASGGILGNMDKNNGFCIVDNKECINLLKNNSSKSLHSTKIFGYKVPSMETYFHSFMKKYTLHIHFTLSNIFLCCDKSNVIDNLGIEYKIIDYFPPGLTLAQKIYEEYDERVDLYFLKNHGLIITGNNILRINDIYEKVFIYFNNLLENRYEKELVSYKINRIIYNKFKKSIICRKYSDDKENKIKNIKYCFPDLAVYIQKIVIIDNLEEIENIPDLIIYENSVYLISDNIIKLYCMIETLDKYKDLCNDYDNLVIVDNRFIQNMEQEKYRKSS